MRRFGMALRRARSRKDLTQEQVSIKLDLSYSRYRQLEDGQGDATSRSIQLIIKNKLFTARERQQLREESERILRKIRKEQLANQNIGDQHINLIKKSRQVKSYDIDNPQRIPNIKNFYKDLNDLGDLSKIDNNDPRLQLLRVRLGGPLYFEGEED